jgi:hypothetical protein
MHQASSERLIHRSCNGVTKRSDHVMNVRSAAILLSLSLASPSFAASSQSDPLRFFEGKTESVGTIKIVMKKPFRSRAVGVGQISSDGTLTLVQRIEDEGQLPRERRWKMRKVGPGKYSGTMTEAKGPVTVDEVDGKYRFRFRMEGSVAVEQWLIPAPDGHSAASAVTIRKYGMTVGHSDSVIHKVN